MNHPFAGQITLASDESSFDLFSARTGSGSATADRDAAPVKTPHQNDDQPSPQKAFAGNSSGGAGSSSSSAPGGASASPVGIVNEIAARVAEPCSGRISASAPLSLATPLAARLLDPPR
jgi:hypothetical protein